MKLSDMNRYGPHTDIVQQIIDFACSGRVLKDADDINDDSLIIEHDFANAVERAQTQGQDNDEEMDEDWLTWDDIRSHELSQFYLTAPEASCDKELNASLSQASQTIRQCLENNLPEPYLRALNDIHGDMSSCARSRALVGQQNDFFEGLFRLYQSGLWPCGWDGNYPGGKLVVYRPHS